MHKIRDIFIQISRVINNARNLLEAEYNTKPKFARYYHKSISNAQYLYTKLKIPASCQ